MARGPYFLLTVQNRSKSTPCRHFSGANGCVQCLPASHAPYPFQADSHFDQELIAPHRRRYVSSSRCSWIRRGGGSQHNYNPHACAHTANFCLSVQTSCYFRDKSQKKPDKACIYIDIRPTGPSGCRQAASKLTHRAYNRVAEWCERPLQVLKPGPLSFYSPSGSCEGSPDCVAHFLKAAHGSVNPPRRSISNTTCLPSKSSPKITCSPSNHSLQALKGRFYEKRPWPPCCLTLLGPT